MSLYDRATIGTASNQIVFNDTSYTPYFRVQSRAPQRRELRELDIQVPFENGINDFRTLIGKTGYVINGTMYPASEADHDNGVQSIRKLASLEFSQADPLSDDGYVPYTWTEANYTKTLFLKVLYANVVENTKNGYVEEFTFVCKLKDPTIFGDSKNFSSQAADPTGGGGTAVYDFTYPTVYGANYYSVSNIAYNDGDIPVYPTTMNVYGPSTDPKITNQATGEYIQLSGITLSSTANVLSITYDKDTISIERDGVSVLSKVTNDSTYFKLQPGENKLLLTGSSVGTGSYLTCSYRSGWPLS